MKPPDRIRIRLLGGVEVFRDDGISLPIRLSTKKVSALVAFLAMNRKQAATREELAALLWGSCSDQQARQSLRQALVLLRKDLRSPNVLIADKETIRLQPGAWAVDVLDFEALADSPKLEDLARAADLFGGELLAGFTIDEEGFDEWLQTQRNRIHAAAGRALAAYAERSDGSGNGQQALAAVERLLVLDPLREDWQRLALRLSARYRGQHEALAQAKRFEALLQRELDVEPEPETEALVEAIRRGEIAPIASEARLAGASADPSSLPGVVSSSPMEAADLGAGVERLNAQNEVGPARRGWRPLGAWSGRGVAAGLMVAAVVLFGGVIGVMHRGVVRVGVDDVSGGKPVEAAAPADDPWRAPRLPSQSADASAGPGRGLVSIAVLPFTSHGEGGERSETIADMMTDDLTNIVSRVPGFRVISRQTSHSYRGQPVDAAAIGAELGIRYLLKGSVQARDNHLQANVDIVDTRSRLNVWSGHFERTGAELSNIEGEIADSLGRELEIEVVRVESERGSKDPDVHELIYKGYAAMFDAATSGLPVLRQAETYFTQALERDPENTRAQTGLGGYHARLAVQLFAPEPEPHLAKAEAILQQVIDKHPSTSEAHQLMGLVHIARGHTDNAARSFERALELNSSCAACYGQLGRALVRMGHPAEGLEHILYAMRLSPRDPVMANWLGMAGGAEVELQHYGKAIEYLDRALALSPGQPRISLVLIGAHALAGNRSEARARLAQLRKTLPHLTGEQLVTRFFGQAGGAEGARLKEGLRLALISPWESPRPTSKHPDGDSTRTRKDIIPIVVLPFKTYGETAGSIRMLSDMMTDDLINTLSRASTVRVISRQTARSYQDQSIDVIGAELQVRYVLEGSMRMVGDKLRVNVELIDPATRLSVWSGRIERDRADRQAVQDEIIGRISRELAFELFPIELERRAKDDDVDTLIYRGWAAMNSAYSKSGLEAFKQAEAYFMQALERDPQNPNAQLGLGAYHANVGAQLLDNESASHLLTALEILQDVVRRRPRASAAHHFMGLSLQAMGNLPDAIDSFERAVELNPSAAGSHAHFGHALARLGRQSEGLEHLQYAMRLSPRDPNLAYWLEFAGGAELELGHHQQAIENLRRSAALNPDYVRSWAGLAAANALAGNIDEAHTYVEKLKTMAPDVSTEGLIKRFGRREGQAPRLREGLRLALAGST